MEVGLIIALFVMNAIALDCLYNHRYKLTGALLIGNLCLSVALCYQFKQMEKIYYLFLIVIGIVVIFFCIRFYIRKRKNSAIIGKDKWIEKSEVIMEIINFEIEMDNGDIMTGELYPDVAPITVSNFVSLVKNHFYDGLIFHRVISGFMIQGGGMDASYTPKDTSEIKGEFLSNGVDNPLLHTRGVLSMARTMVKDSASSQFFIMHEDAPHLDGEYAAFGKIVKGLDVVDKIANVATDFADRPLQPIVIKTMRLL